MCPGHFHRKEAFPTRVYASLKPQSKRPCVACRPQCRKGKLMGSVFSKVSPSGADGAAGSSDGITLDVTPELREQIKVRFKVFGFKP
jgi:hypothetical protein